MKPDPEAPTELVAAADSREPGFRLVATWEGGSIVRDLPLRGEITLGRGAEADVRIDHSSVSRKHARLVLGENFTIEDLGSSNGVVAGGRRIPPRGSAGVRAGEVLELGSSLVVIHERGGAAAVSVSGDVSVVVADPEMERIYQLLELVARSTISILLLGETGVGKEVLAAHVHRCSPRASAPFLRVNCAALVESLLESELFGHERGAFTGAHQAKVGLLEGAHQGTLFLDEVGELPKSVQAKLLRVLESGEVTRIGSLAPRKVDVRFVAATNRDLRSMVTAGAFREDLYFRLEGIAVKVPPLRNRPGEIPALVKRFAAEECALAGRAPMRVTDEALARLVGYSWPGNIRELKNVLRRSILLAKGGALQTSDLRIEEEAATVSAPAPPPLSAAPAPATSADAESGGAGSSKRDRERARILDALNQCGGNQTRAAKMLGIARRTLVHKLDILGVPRPRKRDDDD
jgi:transcriptional regulator with GAF, ATPase, and Fis domain